MKLVNKKTLLLVLFILVFAPTTTALNAIIQVSRDSGVAPLAVFFEGTESTDSSGNKIGHPNRGGGQGLLATNIIEYVWDFGEGTESDVGGRYFSGFNAAHVYETPGNYTVTLTIRDESGEASTSIQVNVETFEGTTYYVSDSEGDDSRSAAEAQNPATPWKTFERAMSAVTSNTKVLFKRGDTFTYSNRASLGNSSNVILGAYGSGERPLIQYTGTASYEAGAPVYEVSGAFSYVDLRFNLLSTAGGRGSGIGENNISAFLFLRTQLEQHKNVVFYNDEVFFVDSASINVDRGNFYFHGSRLAITDSVIGSDPPSTSHNLYGSLIDRGVITRTHWYGVGNGRTNVRLAANSEPHNPDEPTTGSWNIVVSDNHIHNAFKGIEIIETTGQAYGWGVHNLLIERNYIHDEGLGIQITDHGHSNIIIRNNILRDNIYGGLQLADNPNATAGIHGVKFYNNTLLDSISIQTNNHENIEIFNNIFTSISGADGQVSLSNNFLGDPGFVDPANNDFHLRADALGAIDVGMSLPLVYEDYDRKSRPQGLGWDIGAFELEDYSGCVGGAPDGVCEPGETCAPDATDCDDRECYEPTCLAGCGEVPVAFGGSDESCQSPSYCDGFGVCFTPTCADSDADGYDDCDLGEPGDDGNPIDCNDSDPAINPGAIEACDGVDNNCNDTIDEGCSCTVGDTRQCGQTDTGECEYGIQSCAQGQWGQCVGAINPETEVCGNQLDEDCDGSDLECAECAEVVTERCSCGQTVVETGYCCEQVPSTIECSLLEACTDSSECSAGEICCSSACVAPVCSSDADCSERYECVSAGECSAACRLVPPKTMAVNVQEFLVVGEEFEVEVLGEDGLSLATATVKYGSSTQQVNEQGKTVFIAEKNKFIIIVQAPGYNRALLKRIVRTGTTGNGDGANGGNGETNGTKGGKLKIEVVEAQVFVGDTFMVSVTDMQNNSVQEATVRYGAQTVQTGEDGTAMLIAKKNVFSISAQKQGFDKALARISPKQTQAEPVNGENGEQPLPFDLVYITAFAIIAILVAVFLFRLATITKK